MLEMSLQYFAEEEGENPETAEPAAEEVETEGTEVETEEPEEAGVQSAEENAQFAAIRRKAEEDAKRKYETMRDNERKQIDSYYANLCKGKVNPETGAPITTEAEYREALAAQDRINMKNQMQEAGVDPSLLDKAIMASPIMQQAQAAIQENEQYRNQRMIDEDMKEILSFDPSVNSADEVFSQENIHECLDYVASHPGIRLSDAYKIVNFDRLAAARAEAAKQSAINQAKSKDHLTTTGGLSGSDGDVDIPESEIAKWKEWFPEKSRKELRALYNKTISS